MIVLKDLLIDGISLFAERRIIVGYHLVALLILFINMNHSAFSLLSLYLVLVNQDLQWLLLSSFVEKHVT